jgi:predicted nuclease of predicted toxin-antitoxin system
MLRLATDEGFNRNVYKGLLRRVPDLDIVSVHDAGLRGAADPDILAWAASEGRILLTHDRETMIGFAYERVHAGLPMPGVFVITDNHEHIGQMIEDILIPACCSEQHEWRDQVQFLPI